MVLLREHLNEQSTKDSFIVKPIASPKRRRSTGSHSLDGLNVTLHSIESFGTQWMTELETIKEKPRRLSWTHPDISSPQPLSMDVFGESLNSLDVWADEDVFQSPRKNRNIKNRSSFVSKTGVSVQGSLASSRLARLKGQVDLPSL